MMSTYIIKPSKLVHWCFVFVCSIIIIIFILIILFFIFLKAIAKLHNWIIITIKKKLTNSLLDKYSCLEPIRLNIGSTLPSLTSMVESMSETPHSMKKFPRANSADPTMGTLMVMTSSVRGPTDISLSKYQNFTRLYEMVPLLCQVRFTFFSTSLYITLLIEKV